MSINDDWLEVLDALDGEASGALRRIIEQAKREGYEQCESDNGPAPDSLGVRHVRAGSLVGTKGSEIEVGDDAVMNYEGEFDD